MSRTSSKSKTQNWSTDAVLKEKNLPANKQILSSPTKKICEVALQWLSEARGSTNTAKSSGVLLPYYAMHYFVSPMLALESSAA